MDGEERVALKDAAAFLLDECRMVLPGIQALFGFQLVAVFSDRFEDDLTRAQAAVHFTAIALVVVAIALIMTPAALHRRIGVERVTRDFIHASHRLLAASMVPLALAIGLDFFLIAQIVLDGAAAIPLTLAILAVFAVLWGVVPRLAERRRAGNSFR